jgi:hypothetical protein
VAVTTPISGENVLEHAIDYVGQEWLSGIGGVDDWFISALTGSSLTLLARASYRRLALTQRRIYWRSA